MNPHPPTGDTTYSGKPCKQPGCTGKLFVETTEIFGQRRRRTLKCKKCRKPPANKYQWVLLQDAPPQASRKKKK